MLDIIVVSSKFWSKLKSTSSVGCSYKTNLQPLRYNSSLENVKYYYKNFVLVFFSKYVIKTTTTKAPIHVYCFTTFCQIFLKILMLSHLGCVLDRFLPNYWEELFTRTMKRIWLFRTNWKRVTQLSYPVKGRQNGPASLSENKVQSFGSHTVHLLIVFPALPCQRLADFGPDLLKALTGWTRPPVDWIIPSLSLSCTCCQQQGGPTAAAVQPTLEHVITALKLITLFTHGQQLMTVSPSRLRLPRQVRRNI